MCTFADFRKFIFLALFSLFLFTACGSDDVEQIQSDLATLEAKTDQLTADLNQLQADLNEQAEPATECLSTSSSGIGSPVS
jgi:outer membrane murein-binding lipoprotein Lpp